MSTKKYFHNIDKTYEEGFLVEPCIIHPSDEEMENLAKNDEGFSVKFIEHISGMPNDKKEHYLCLVGRIDCQYIDKILKDKIIELLDDDDLQIRCASCGACELWEDHYFIDALNKMASKEKVKWFRQQIIEVSEDISKMKE